MKVDLIKIYNSVLINLPDLLEKWDTLDAELKESYWEDCHWVLSLEASYPNDNPAIQEEINKLTFQIRKMLNEHFRTNCFL